MHRAEWEWELLELKIFNTESYTDIEYTLFLMYDYFLYYFVKEKRNIARKYIFYDLWYYIWFFLIEDLFLYYTQLELILLYLYKYFFIIFKGLKRVLRYMYFLCKFIIFKINLIGSFFKIFNYVKIFNYLAKNFFIFLHFLEIVLFSYFLKIKKNFKNFKKISVFI